MTLQILLPILMNQTGEETFSRITNTSRGIKLLVFIA